MSNSETQAEEQEVLASIYDGDECFKQISPTVYQYKYGINEEVKSFVLEIRWGENYPEEKPDISMDAFYNRHILPPVKERVVSVINEEAEQYLGMSMTYSLFEFMKEKFEEIIEEQPEQIVEATVEKLTISEDQDEVSKKPVKKEQLTKAQKRRQWDKTDNKGEKPRGWNWVDIVKHLSQTGGKESTPAS